MPTHIQWSDETWNPTSGCHKVGSPGCENCYIERTIPFRMEGRKFDADGKMEVRLHPDRMDKPLHWRNPRRVFVNSLSDLFHADIPSDFIADVFATMAATERHTYQILTKRPQRMAKLIGSKTFQDLVQDWGRATMRATDPAPRLIDQPWPLANVHLGVSIESDPWVWRADWLRKTPAVVRFLSLEPLLSALPSLDLTGIDQCIVGGESGPLARPMHPNWAREIRNRCQSEGIAYFFKQWGEWGPVGTWKGPDHHMTIDGRLFQPGERLGPDHMCSPAAMHRWGKKLAGRLLDGREWNEMPERSHV